MGREFQTENRFLTYRKDFVLPKNCIFSKMTILPAQSGQHQGPPVGPAEHIMLGFSLTQSIESGMEYNLGAHT